MTSPFNTNCYMCMLFVLRIAPSTIQRALDNILFKTYQKSCLVFIDDLVIILKISFQHVKDNDDVLTLLRQAGMNLKLSVLILSKKIENFGFVFMPGRLSAAIKNISAS